MQIQVSFDTDKEDIADLKKLCGVLQSVIYRREGKMPIAAENLNEALYQPDKFAPTQESAMHAPSIQGQFAAVNAPSLEEKPIVKKETQKDQRTAGGGRVIPFEDMDDMMSRIYSGKKY